MGNEGLGVVLIESVVLLAAGTGAFGGPVGEVRTGPGPA